MVKIGIDRAGPRVVVSARIPSGARLDLDLHRRGALTLGALLSAAGGSDEDAEYQCQLDADLTVKEPPHE
jgi:hypothetical protein